MQVGDLVISRAEIYKEHPVYGIIVADVGLSSCKTRMWHIRWINGTWCVLHQFNLEVVCK